MKKDTSNFPLSTFYGSAGYLGLPQTQNRYAYCINNPLKYIDPLGLDGVENGVWTKYPEIWFYIYGSGEMPTLTVIPYNWWSTLSLIQQREILGYGNDPGIGRPPGYVPPSPEEIIILNLGNPGFENYRLGENGMEIIKEPSSGQTRSLNELQKSHRQGYKWITYIGAASGIITVFQPHLAPITGPIAAASGITGLLGSLMSPKGTFTETDILFSGITAGLGVILPQPYAAVVGAYSVVLNEIGQPHPSRLPYVYPWIADHTFVYIKK